MSNNVLERHESLRRGCRVLAVAAPPGASDDKSAVALNAALYLGHHLRGTDQRVCFIDANFEHVATGALLGQTTPNIVEIVDNLYDKDYLANVVTACLIEQHEEWNVSFLLGPDDFTNSRVITPRTYNAELYLQVLDVLRSQFDYIVIDTPRKDSWHDILRKFALPEADRILVPLAPTKRNIIVFRSWADRIAGPDQPEENIARGKELNYDNILLMVNRTASAEMLDNATVRSEVHNFVVDGIRDTDPWGIYRDTKQPIVNGGHDDIDAVFATALYVAIGTDTLEP